MSKTIEISVYDLQELRNENKMLHEEQWRLHRLWSKDTKHISELEEENKKLNEFKEKRKESMFYFKAQMERAEPKTASEAEDLQRAKEIFEKLYREELHYLEEENKKLKDKFMLKLAEAYLLPPTSNQMAEYKKWNYSKWYDEVKNQMRKEIKEWK